MRWLDGIIDSIDMKVKVAQSCPTLCDPMDCSLPGSSVHGSLQARILEWVAVPLPADLPNPGIKHCSFNSLSLELPEKPTPKTNTIL